MKKGKPTLLQLLKNIKTKTINSVKRIFRSTRTRGINKERRDRQLFLKKHKKPLSKIHRLDFLSELFPFDF